MSASSNPVSPTPDYVKVLGTLKPGDLGLLRAHAGQGLDESVQGFDLFAGLWWPLRQRNQSAPRREVAWLIAKLYAYRPLPQSDGDTLALRMRAVMARTDPDKRPHTQQKFDQMLAQPLDRIEPLLRWALDALPSDDPGLDWVRLTDDLSYWEHESKRLQWAADFLGHSDRR